MHEKAVRISDQDPKILRTRHTRTKHRQAPLLNQSAQTARAENVISDHPEPSPGDHRRRRPKRMGQTQGFILNAKHNAPPPVRALGKVPPNRLLVWPAHDKHQVAHLLRQPI